MQDGAKSPQPRESSDISESNRPSASPLSVASADPAPRHEMPRCPSAPAALELELQKDALFAFNSIEYANIFTDIRCDDEYADFYNAFSQQQKLPPPFDPEPIGNQFLLYQQHREQPAEVLTGLFNNLSVFENETPSPPSPAHNSHFSSVGGDDDYHVSSPYHHSHHEHPAGYGPPMLNGNSDLFNAQMLMDSLAQLPNSDSQDGSCGSSRTSSPSRDGKKSSNGTRKLRRPEDRKRMDPADAIHRTSKHQSKLVISNIHSPQDLIGKVTVLSKDQNGCRFLQSLLDESQQSFVDVIYIEVFDNAAELMVDPFGNYLCQKLMEKCTDQQRVEFIKQVSYSLVNISLNIHGTRAVQKLIDCVDRPHQIEMVANALGANVVPLIKDLNGNHVIQRCLQKFGADNSQFIFDAVARHLVDVATHRHGCCVLQRCIDHANVHQRKLLVQEIAANALRLVQDPFGNYVVQYVLDLCPEAEQAIIIVKFIGSVAQLSTQKFSSNVIEKCLEIADKDVQLQFLIEIANDSSVPVLLNDPYGNYVMQRALAVADDQMFELLCDRIRPHIPSLRSTPYGKRIHNKLLKKFPILGQSSPSQGPEMHHHHHHHMRHMSPMHGNGYGQDTSPTYSPHFMPHHAQPPMVMVNPYSRMHHHHHVVAQHQPGYMNFAPDYGMPPQYE